MSNKTNETSGNTKKAAEQISKLNERKQVSQAARSAIHTDKRPGKYYQYRTLSDFWQIINSDELWARNIKYSNDLEEQRLGQRICEKFRSSSNKYDEEYYMLCFSEDNDSLSQWRGYASHSGVAIGFEFNAVELFHIKSTTRIDGSAYKTGDATVVTDESIGEDDRSADEILKEYVFLSPYQVLYAENDENNEGYAKISEVLKSEDEGISSISPSELIPYIKHAGFYEEREWRIIINKTMDNCDIVGRVHYQYGEENNLMTPYIILQPGFDNQKAKDVPFIRIQVQDNNLISQIRKDDALVRIYGDGASLNDHIIDCSEQKEYKDGCLLCIAAFEGVGDKTVIDGGILSKRLCPCSGRGTENGYYMPKVNQIILSQGKKQEEIFNRIYKIIFEYNMKAQDQNTKVKVWCEGHLPIREVVIGPCSNMDDVKNSIENYFKHSDKYWLRCVDVISSELPYRAPKN